MKLLRLFGSIAALGMAVLLNLQIAPAQMNKIEFTEYDLPNGLHVILHHDNSAPICATVVHYRVGSRDENPKRTGFAHFFEHLMFEATDHIARASIDKLVQGAGGDLNAHTSFDETVYYFHLPSNEVNLALWIEGERMRKLHVDSIGVETQRGVVKEEKKGRYENSPYGTWNEKMFAHLFEGGSYSWTPIGSAQHIDIAKISEFKEFYDKFYQPSNAVLVVAGDFNERDVREHINAYFGQYTKSPELVREKFVLPEMTQGFSETINDPKAQLPAVFIGYRGPKKGEDDSYAMSMLSDIFANGESSRLYQRLVDKEQIAVQASTFPFSLQYGGAQICVGIAAPGKSIDSVEAIIYQEIELLKKDGVTEVEFQKAKNIKEAEFVEGKKGAHEKAQTLAAYYSYFGDANLINTEIAKFQKVTKDDLKRVANKYFNDKRVVLRYIPGTGKEDGGQQPAGNK